MILGSGRAGERRAAPRRGRVRRWPVWSLPARGLAFVLAVDVAAAGLTAVALGQAQLTADVAGRFALLAVLSTVYAEAADRVARLRRYLGSDTAFANHSGVWVFAGAVVLPAGYAALLGAFIYAHALLRSRRHRSARPYRLVFTGAAEMLAALLAAVILAADPAAKAAPGAGPAGAALLVAALVAYTVLNLAVVLSGIVLAGRPASPRTLLPGRDEWALQVATLALGALMAELVIHAPWLSPAGLLLLGVLHRAALVRQLEIVASTDAKTGLLTSAAWRRVATQRLDRARHAGLPAAVLVIDLDHFKQINDMHGHLAGDRVLADIGEQLRQELRGADAVGRFGGEEFVVYLDAIAPDTAGRISRRLGQCIRSVGVAAADGAAVRVTASIGMATYPRHGEDLDQLLAAADAALYEAKRSGRDTVCISP